MEFKDPRHNDKAFKYMHNEPRRMNEKEKV